MLVVCATLAIAALARVSTARITIEAEHPYSVRYTSDAEADRIHEIPGVGHPPSAMFSGYFHANKDGARENGVRDHLHYWFVESEGNPDKDPLVLWLNGGPGASSLMGFLTEFGPLILDDKEGVTHNPYAWTRLANMLFFESPSGVGFSYCETPNEDGTHSKTEKCFNSDTDTAAQNLAALNAFLERFPHFRGRDFMIWGESYAGVYVPTLSLEVFNSKLDMNFLGFGVGNPCTDDPTQVGLMGWTPRYAYANGLIDDGLYDKLTKKCGLKEDVPGSRPISTTEECTLLYRQYMLVSSAPSDPRKPPPADGFIDGYNVWGAKNQLFWDASAKWLNRPEVQEALNVRQHKFEWTLFATRLEYTKEYQACNCYEKADAKLPKYSHSMIPIYQNLAGKVRNILVFNGDTDPSVQMKGTANAVRAMGKSVVAGGEWRPWFYKTIAADPEFLKKKSPYWGYDLSPSANLGSQMGGYVVSYEDGLTFASIHHAGHMVPQYTTIAAYHLFKRALENKPLSPPLPDFKDFADTPDDIFFGTDDRVGVMWKWVEKAKSDIYVGGDKL